MRFKLGNDYRNFAQMANFPRGSGESRFDTTTNTGGRDATVTGTPGSVSLRGGGHPWLPANAASQPRVSDVMPYCPNSALGTSPARI
jgi:hypothetical protein